MVSPALGENEPSSMEASALQLASADTVMFLHCATGGSGGNGRLNTVPWPELPPNPVVPYRVLVDKINPGIGLAAPPPGWPVSSSDRRPARARPRLRARLRARLRRGR